MDINNKLVVNVYDYGAVGNGVADDTTAIEKAAAEAARTKLQLFFPNGIFRVTRTITFEPITVVGHMSGAWCADRLRLPIIQIDHDSGPGFILRASSLSGLNISCSAFLKRTGQPPKQPAVVTGMTGARISNMKFNHCWEAIVCDDDVDNREGNPGRLNIENCFILNAHNKGVYISGMADVGTMRNVEVWSPDSKTLAESGVAFHFRKNDGIHVSDCFAFNASIGFLFDEMVGNPLTNGGTQAWLTSCNSDFCTQAIVVRGNPPKNKREYTSSHIAISGGSYWGHFQALTIESGYCRVMASAAEFRANGAPALDINGGECVMLSSCLITRVFPHEECSAVAIKGGEQTLLTGCTIQSHNDGIELHEGANIFSMTGCVIDVDGQVVIDKSSCNTQISANIIKPNY